MIVLGLLLIAGGLLAVAAALLSSSGSATYLGADLGAATIFFLGLAAGLAVLWGYSITKLGTRRSWRLRRENRQLREQNARGSQRGEPARTPRPSESRRPGASLGRQVGGLPEPVRTGRLHPDHQRPTVDPAPGQAHVVRRSDPRRVGTRAAPDSQPAGARQGGEVRRRPAPRGGLAPSPSRLRAQRR